MNEPVEYAQASAEVRAVYDDIMATRKTDWVNNYWKVLARHPPSLRRMWANAKEVMGPGALDPLTKELIYMAVSVTNGCDYCIASHGAAARSKGMTLEQHAELVAIIGLANETNRHAAALVLQIDDKFR
jgi:AhpD family alkylhydroperoxidase